MDIVYNMGGVNWVLDSNTNTAHRADTEAEKAFVQNEVGYTAEVDEFVSSSGVNTTVATAAATEGTSAYDIAARVDQIRNESSVGVNGLSMKACAGVEADSTGLVDASGSPIAESSKEAMAAQLRIVSAQYEIADILKAGVSAYEDEATYLSALKTIEDGVNDDAAIIQQLADMWSDALLGVASSANSSTSSVTTAKASATVVKSVSTEEGENTSTVAAQSTAEALESNALKSLLLKKQNSNVQTRLSQMYPTVEDYLKNLLGYTSEADANEQGRTFDKTDLKFYINLYYSKISK